MCYPLAFSFLKQSTKGSIDSFIKKISLVSRTEYAFSIFAESMLTPSIFLPALTTFLASAPGVTRRSFLFFPPSPKTLRLWAKTRVFGSIFSNPVIIFISPSLSFADKPEERAAFFTFLGNFVEWSLGFGPKTGPPFTKLGAFFRPCLGLPGPFWLLIFLEKPL